MSFLLAKSSLKWWTSFWSVKWIAHRCRIPHPLIASFDSEQSEKRARCKRLKHKSTRPMSFFFTVYRSCAISIQNFVQLVHSLPEWSSVEGSGRSGFAIATHLRFKRQQQQTTKKKHSKAGRKAKRKEQSARQRQISRTRTIEYDSKVNIRTDATRKSI